MAIAAISGLTNSGEEKDAKSGRVRRPRPMPGLARKINELAAQLGETARLEAERDRKDDGRVRAILNAASGGGIERMLRSMNLSEPDKDFLREKGWRL